MSSNLQNDPNSSTKTLMAEKTIELITELHRKPNSIPVYNDGLVKAACDEIQTLYDENAKDVGVSFDSIYVNQ